MKHLSAVCLTCLVLNGHSSLIQGIALQIPPDHASVDGLVLSVFQKENTSWALVKVTSIKGYGAGFRGAITPNDTLEVQLPTSIADDVSASQVFSGLIKQGLSELGSSNPTYVIETLTKY